MCKQHNFICTFVSDILTLIVVNLLCPEIYQFIKSKTYFNKNLSIFFLCYIINTTLLPQSNKLNNNYIKSLHGLHLLFVSLSLKS